eukprot:56003-Chlamydomonas_euryale.AAC.1
MEGANDVRATWVLPENTISSNNMPRRIGRMKQLHGVQLQRGETITSYYVRACDLREELALVGERNEPHKRDDNLLARLLAAYEPTVAHIEDSTNEDIALEAVGRNSGYEIHAWPRRSAPRWHTLHTLLWPCTSSRATLHHLPG